MKRVILNLIATNKYTFFLDGIIESSRKMFANDCELNFIVYTDSDLIFDSIDIKKIYTEGENWPMPTLKRFHYFLLAENEIMKSDFSFYIDVDSLFRNPLNLSDIIKSEEGLIGTLHPGFIGSLGTPERNPNSTAYIPWDVKCPYFCGGFFGGDSRSFIDMAKYISSAIDTDLKNDIIAIWHDESHLNKYFNLIKKPSIILGDGFTAPEEYLNNKTPYIVFLDKRDNEEISKIKNKQ